MSRTEEQIAADDALTEAIGRVLRAYADDGEAWVAMEYLVLTTQQRYDNDGEALTAVGVLYRDGDVPLHRALGLVEYAATRMRKTIVGEGDD